MVPRLIGSRWSAELELTDGNLTHAVFLNRTFVTEMLARDAGEQTLAEWLAGRVVVRDLMLQELAAVYRQLRSTYKLMQPAAVPATRSGWEQAIGVWEGLGWIQATDATRYRSHARVAFEAESGPVRRHKLGIDAEL